MILNKALLKKFVKLAGERLTGDWILIGGTVLPYLGAEHRTTTDIDFVGLGSKEKAQQFEVMQIVEDLGLPVETINSAADFFAHKQVKSKSQLVLLHQGGSAVIYRPNTELYFRLKLPRLSEIDAEDCVVWLRHLRPSKVELTAVAKLVQRELKTTREPQRIERLNQIRNLLAE